MSCNAARLPLKHFFPVRKHLFEKKFSSVKIFKFGRFIKIEAMKNVKNYKKLLNFAPKNSLIFVKFYDIPRIFCYTKH